MMKKNGFTLAEVLITLAIIGVIATMTLPALMTNIAEQQARTGLKKGINTLTEAAQMHEAIEGINYGDINNADIQDRENMKSLFGILAQRTSMDFAKSGKGAHEKNGVVDSNNYAVFFRDGSIMMFDPAATMDATAHEKEDDDLPKGFGVIYDTNGVKGPNVLSNCQSKIDGVESDVPDATAEPGGDIKECSTENRVIKDQFGIKLRGAYAVPNGPAARWTYQK